MSDSYSENWWTDLRWRVGNQFVLWGLKMMPDGDAKGALLDKVYEWTEEAQRQWWYRAQRSRTTSKDQGE